MKLHSRHRPAQRGRRLRAGAGRAPSHFLLRCCPLTAASVCLSWMPPQVLLRVSFTDQGAMSGLSPTPRVRPQPLHVSGRVTCLHVGTAGRLHPFTRRWECRLFPPSAVTFAPVRALSVSPGRVRPGRGRPTAFQIHAAECAPGHHRRFCWLWCCQPLTMSVTEWVKGGASCSPDLRFLVFPCTWHTCIFTCGCSSSVKSLFASLGCFFSGFQGLLVSMSKQTSVPAPG